MNRSEAGKLGNIASRPAFLANRQSKIDLYCENPIKCLVCYKSISYENRLKNKFCSRSCSAKLNNNKFPKRAKTAIQPQPWEDRIRGFTERFERGEVTQRMTLKKHMLRKHGHACMSCKNATWMGAKIPLDLHHVDGVALHNMPDNLSLLCPNCHAQTSNYKYRNKGNGRKALGMKHC